MKRVTVGYFSWDWTQLLGSRVIDIADTVLADPRAVHGLITGLKKSVVPNPPAHIHIAVAMGEVPDRDLISDISSLQEAYKSGKIPKTESWE